MTTKPWKRLVALLLSASLVFASVPVQAGKITRYVHTDHLGSVSAKTDSTGVVMMRRSFTPYGENEQAVTDGPGYTGHYSDTGTGLVYMQARYYDPVIGWFLSVDPMTFAPNRPQFFNRYWYANGNPYKYIDPDGRCAAVVVCAGIITLGVITIAAFINGVQGTQKALENADNVMSNEGVENPGDDAGSPASDNADPLDKVLDGATPGRETKGRTTNWEKSGGLDQANKDFDELVPDGGGEIEGLEGARKGVTEDGRNVNVRPTSSDDRPTVEVQDGKNRIKIRYDK